MSSIPPPGYRAVLLGASTTLEGLSEVNSLEEGAPEGRLMLMKLDFEESPSADMLAELNQQLNEAGVPSWPGYTQVAYADATQPTIYICWTKGFVFSSIIIRILIFMLIPALLAAFVWWLLPEELTDLITMMAMMMIVVLMMKMMTPMLEEEK